MNEKTVVRAFGIALWLTIVVAGFGQAVLQLWNWLMPDIFGLRVITFWQAVGLMGLSWVLFGGWRGDRAFGAYMARRTNGRWGHMTSEEREKFRKGLRGPC